MLEEKVTCRKCKRELENVIRLFMVRMTWDNTEKMYAPNDEEVHSDLVRCLACGKGVTMERVHGNS